MSQNIDDLGFEFSIVDPDVWIKPRVNTYGE